MFSHKRRIVSGVSGALMLALTVGVSAEKRLHAFEVTLQGNANPTPTDNPCILINSEVGTGRVSQLGEITWASHEIVNFCSNPDGADVFGAFNFTFATGDQLFGVYRTLAHLDPVSNEVKALGRYEITGGTGGFAGAKGDGVISADGSLLPPFGVTGALAGAIVY